MLHEAILSATSNATNVALHAGKKKKYPSKTLFSQPAVQPNVTLQVAGKVQLLSTFRNVASVSRNFQPNFVEMY